MTLMISEGWPAVTSNALLNATCGQGKPFYEAYEAARKNILPAKDKGVLTAPDVKIEKKGQNEAVFVLLKEPVCFKGKTKNFN